MSMAHYVSESILNELPHTEMRRDKTVNMKKGIFGRFMSAVQTAVPEKSIKSSGRTIKNEGLTIFSEFMIWYPLHCVNILVAKVVPQLSHVVDTWIEGLQAQEMNTQRSDFKNNLHVMASCKKYSKSGVECLRALVHQLGLDQVGYPINMEGLKVMNIIWDAISKSSYEDDAAILQGQKDMSFNY